MSSEMTSGYSLFKFLIFIVFKSAMLKMASQLSPTEVLFKVQPSSVYYPTEPEDVIYFEGSTVEFTCDVFCEHDCTSSLYIYYNNSVLLVDNNLALFGAPFNFELYKSEHPTKVTLKITDATASIAGSYQCLTGVWRNAYIVSKEANFRMAVLGPTKQEIKFVSYGDNVFLPCVIDASNNIYPQPDHIEWWKDNIQCDPLGCESGSFITQNGGLVLTNITANVSYHCVVHWRSKIHNASQYLIVVNQSGTHGVKVDPDIVQAKVGENIQFVCVVTGFGQNYSVKWYRDHSDEALPTINDTHALDINLVQQRLWNDLERFYCVVTSESGVHVNASGILKVVEPPHIADIDDILVDVDGQNNVTLSCSFTGRPIPSVHWLRVLEESLFPEWQYFNGSTIVNGTTATLTLSNITEHLGSYQCVAVNEAGYVSRTARVLPKGWTNVVRHLKADFIDDENYTIQLSWDPPEYDGGIPVHYYKLILYDGLDPSLMVEILLEDSFNGTVYLWDKLEQHTDHSGDFTIWFGVIVSDLLKNNRSDIVQTDILTQLDLPLHLQVTLMVNCENTNVSAEWKLEKRHHLDDINGYCLEYHCNTSSKLQRCEDETRNHTIISQVPTNTTCWFNLTVRGRKEVVSNEVSCHRSNPVTLSSSLPSPYSSTPFSPLDLSQTLSPPLFKSSSLKMSTDISPTSSPPLKSSLFKTSLFTTNLSPTHSSPPSSTLLPSVFLSMSQPISSISPSSVVYQSTKASNINSWPFMVLIVIITLFTFLGILAVILIMRKRSNNRKKLTHEQPSEVPKAFDFDDNIKDTISDTETIVMDGDHLSLFDAMMQYWDTEKMLRKIVNSNTFESGLSLPSFGSNNDSGEAASNTGCASHYFGVENSSIQAHQYDSGNSIIDNDGNQVEDGSSTKIS